MSPTAQHALRRRTPEEAIAFLERVYKYTSTIEGDDEDVRREVEDEHDPFTPHKCEIAILEIRLAVAEGKV